MAEVGSPDRLKGIPSADAGSSTNTGMAHGALGALSRNRAPGDPTVERAASERSRIFEHLLCEVLDRAYSVARYLSRDPDAAEDLVQEAALRAFSAFDQFQAGTNFRAWFMRILTNCFFAQCRRKRREPVMTSYEDVTHLHRNQQMGAVGLPTEGENPAAVVISRMGEHQVAEAIAGLPEEFRVVCTLYFMEEASYRDIAEMLGRPVGTVRSRLHRGRKMLQNALWAVAEEHGIVDRVAPRSMKSRSQIRVPVRPRLADATTA